MNKKLRKALAEVRAYVVDWGLEKEVHEIIDEALKGTRQANDG